MFGGASSCLADTARPPYGFELAERVRIDVNAIATPLSRCNACGSRPAARPAARPLQHFEISCALVPRRGGSGFAASWRDAPAASHGGRPSPWALQAVRTLTVVARRRRLSASGAGGCAAAFWMTCIAAA